ncbi:hypothetical protein OC835_000344 [Tilletia horrida]|nr:hypothetical protein OC835_000344 [Tilletia horrida]KAK0559259.1 hypothetical protein OC844_004535 [Tilletia horrida]
MAHLHHHHHHGGNALNGGNRAGLAGSTNSAASGAAAGGGSSNGRRGKQNAGAQNLNHLLSFTLPPRAPPPPAYARRSSRRAGSGSGGSSWQAYDKERYLNAQYRFLVKPTEDYTAHFADPDIYLPWSHIVQVLIPTSSALSSATTGLLPSQAQAPDAIAEGATCPICLSPPSAPRITRCGHVYCYPCILHYLATSADASAGSSAARTAFGADPYNTSTSGTSTPARGAGTVPGAARLPSVPSASAHLTSSVSNSGASTPTRRNNGPPPGSAEATAANYAAAAFLPRLQKFSRCPICGDPVYARDLKAVKWFDARGAERKFIEAIQNDSSSASMRQKNASGSNDEYLTLRLIERPHLTTLALPQSSTWPPQTSPSAQPAASDRHASFLDPETKRALELSSSPSSFPADHGRSESSANGPSGGPVSTNAAPWHFLPDVMTFAKFMLATPTYLLSSLAEDLSELAVERALLDGSQPGSGGTVDELGLVFVEMAERKVEEQMGKVRTELDTQWVRRRINVARAELTDHEEKAQQQLERDRDRAQKTRQGRAKKGPARANSSTAAAGGGAEGNAGAEGALAQLPDDPAVGDFLATKNIDALFLPPSVVHKSDQDEADSAVKGSGTGRNQRTRRNLNPPAPISSSSLFYQAASGQNIFLHPLDIKVLRTQYNSYALFPRHLRVKVGGADESTVTADLRRRCKYLNHLPMSADVVFIEIDWEGMVAEAEAEAKTALEASTVAVPVEDAVIEEQDLDKTVSSLPQPDKVTVSHHRDTREVYSTTTRSGLPIVQRVMLKPYEQALRQRRQRRSDKTRKEDRAKLRAEEAERAASAAALAGHGGSHHGVVNGGRSVRPLEMPSSRSQARRSEAWDSSSAGGGGGTTTTANTQSGDDQYSRSFTSASENGGPGSYGSGSAFAAQLSASSTSPSFRDAAMVGAERVFPIHPGREAEAEDFPDMLRSSIRAGDDASELSSDEGAEGEPSGYAARPQNGSRRQTAKGGGNSALPKTVWGTTAARPWAPSNRNDHGGAEDYGWNEMDDAWLELEEDFILGTGGHGPRKTSGGAASLLNKESRGLNSQSSAGALSASSAGGAASHGSADPSRSRTRPTAAAARAASSSLLTSDAGAVSSSRVRAQHQDGASSVASRGAAATAADQDVDVDASAAAASGRKQKAKKKKLVLTAGGRGR